MITYLMIIITLKFQNYILIVLIIMINDYTFDAIRDELRNVTRNMRVWLNFMRKLSLQNIVFFFFFNRFIVA